MAFVGITFDGQNVAPSDDGALYQAHYGDGIIDGCALSLSGDDLVIQNGHIIAGGRACKVDGATPVDLSGRTLSTGYIQVILNYDISQAEGNQWYESFVESATTTFPALTQDDINGTGTLYQLQLAIVQVSGGNLVGITQETGISIVIVRPTRVGFTGDARMSVGSNGAYFAQQGGGGLYCNDTGYTVIYGNNQPIYFRPKGAFDSSGQVLINTSGQQVGGHSQLFQYGTKAVSANTETTIMSFTIPLGGLYVLSCYMDSNTGSTDSAYNNRLNIPSASIDRTIRSTMRNGGGSCYCGIYNVGDNATVNITGYAPVACTLRATFTATKLA